MISPYLPSSLLTLLVGRATDSDARLPSLNGSERRTDGTCPWRSPPDHAAGPLSDWASKPWHRPPHHPP